MKLIVTVIFIFVGLTGCSTSSSNKQETVVPHQKGMDRDAVLEAIRSEKVAIQGCYEKELKIDKDLKGYIKLKWLIGPGGVASKTELTDSNMENADISSCVINIIAKIKYPEPPQGVLGEVHIPFTFGK